MTATKDAGCYRKEGVQVDLPAVDLLEIGLCAPRRKVLMAVSPVHDAILCHALFIYSEAVCHDIDK